MLRNFIYLLWSYSVTIFEFSCLARLAKPYPVSGPTDLPQIPNQCPAEQNSAHQVLVTIYLT